MMTRNPKAQATSAKVLITFGLMFAAGGMLLIPLMAFLHVSANETRNWQTTEGKVTTNIVRRQLTGHTARTGRSRFRSGDNRGVEFAPAATYRYQVNGQTFTSSRYGLGQGMPRFREEVEARAYLNDGFTAGSKVTVHYDPKDPSSAVLSIGSSSVFFYMGLFGVALLAAGALFVWLGRRSLWVARSASAAAVGNPVGPMAQPSWPQR
ncbi:MAG: DUF3592 domain-containing protein [Bryobacterales bacterium]|jgi:hypothetical protein|nr:DUF3592 domain-containing protein [Bryobacterales bacterium]